MTRDVDTSENWSIEQETMESGREKITATHDETDVSIVAKQYPNGAELRLQKPADLPGGYDVVHDEEKRSQNVAVSELERYAAMYDEEGTWLVEGAPVLH